jgi:hypothetical protein
MAIQQVLGVCWYGGARPIGMLELDNLHSRLEKATNAIVLRIRIV